MDTANDDLRLKEISPAIGSGRYGSDRGGVPLGSEIGINMIPNETPVTVNPGSYFRFTGILENNRNVQQTVDVLIYLRLPGGSMYGPLHQFNNIPLTPYQIVSTSNVPQAIPGYAMLGTYDYVAYSGEYPSIVHDSAMFEFSIVNPIRRNSDDWDINGWYNDAVNVLPSVATLDGNYPNPFNSETNIMFELPLASHVSLEIYNLLGQKVSDLVDGYLNPGYHTVQWDASTSSSGIYFYKLMVGENTFLKQMTLLK